MAEWFVGPVMDKIINACSDYLEGQFMWRKGKNKELERLRDNHLKIQAVVFASNQAEIKDQNLNKWLWKLRDAIDEADDLLDEFEYMKHEERLANNTENTKKRKIERARKILKTHPNLKRLVEVVQKLDKVSADVGNFLHLVESTKQEQQKQELELYKNVLIGRKEEKAYIMQWLSKPSNEEDQTLKTGNDLYRNISLLSIVGHGGMGKTTLLQHVYEDQMTEQFELKMWVCVSSDFDMKRVTANILESLSMTNILESLSKKMYFLYSLDALQGRLKSKVRFKKFLLVLDDIWEGEDWDNSKWGNVLAPLAYGGPGSKILVTTRMDSVAMMIAKAIEKKKETLILKGLEDDECLQLLNTHAFADVENLGDHKKLRLITGDMIKKLSGSPLAAKVIGGVLNSSMDEREWIKVSKSEFGSAEFGQDDIMSILKLSYNSLSRPLQNCFAFCSIFPEDHEFDKDDLVRMWIAVGFIQPTCIQGETMEDIGRRYFDVLIKSSFIGKYLNKFEETCYKMHDLLHELARSVSIQEFLGVVDYKELTSIIPETIRHLTVKTRSLEVLRKIENLKNLRSLHITYYGGGQDVSDVLAKIFKACRSIRLLCLKKVEGLEMLPEEIGYFMHLRYLRVDYNSFTMLPRSLSTLYHLQFLMVSNMTSLSNREGFLPRDINILSCLRYLEMPWNVIPVIHGIGKLKFLQELEFYHRNEIGYKIGELEHMNDLCKLRIKFIDNVENAEEACNAKLCDKRNLAYLLLEWSEIQSSNLIDLNEKVLDNLQPHNCLKNLRIFNYLGARSSIWMNNANLICNVERIELSGCLEWKTLPPFGQLPFLKYLGLYNMPKVTQIDNKFHENGKFYVFPSLEELQIVELKRLEDWFDAAVAATTTTDDCFFPCLVKLVLCGCPKLKELPFLPPKLMSLSISCVGWKTLNCCSISKSFPLKKLEVYECRNITSLHMVHEIARPATLRFLSIEKCPNLVSFGGHQEVENTDNCQLTLNDLYISDPFVLQVEPLRSITSLKKLSISSNNELVSFPIVAEKWFLKVSSSLCELRLFKLTSLESLPSSLESLSSLKFLDMMDVPQLKLLPNLPPSLKSLSISGCHKELEKRYRKDVGSDWHKIARIPFVYIYV